MNRCLLVKLCRANMARMQTWLECKPSCHAVRRTFPLAVQHGAAASLDLRSKGAVAVVIERVEVSSLSEEKAAVAQHMHHGQAAGEPAAATAGMNAAAAAAVTGVASGSSHDPLLSSFEPQAFQTPLIHNTP